MPETPEVPIATPPHAAAMPSAPVRDTHGPTPPSQPRDTRAAEMSEGVSTLCPSIHGMHGRRHGNRLRTLRDARRRLSGLRYYHASAGKRGRLLRGGPRLSHRGGGEGARGSRGGRPGVPAPALAAWAFTIGPGRPAWGASLGSACLPGNQSIVMLPLRTRSRE